MKRLLLFLLVPLPLLAAQPAHAATFVDVGGSHWARNEIRQTAVVNDWLEVDGTKWYPDLKLNRRFLAYGLVRAFAPEGEIKPDLKFKDLEPWSDWYRYANIAVKHHWLLSEGNFRPNDPVTKDELSRAIVRALKLTDVANGINGISSADGYKFKHSAWLGYRMLAQELQLYWNRPNGKTEVWPSSFVTRADFAYALAQVGESSWRVWSAQRYEDIVLPAMSPLKRKVVEFALRYVGYPYIYADEGPTGFDCSGFVWWVMRDEMPNDSLRGYDGWKLAERSSYTMAAVGSHIGYKDLRVGDIPLWDVEGPYEQKASAVGHAGLFVGNGWMIHSSGSRGGVTMSRMDEGYWRENLVWARRIMPFKS